MTFPGWMSRAACRGMGPHPFFGPEGETTAMSRTRVLQAQAICGRCAVRLSCLEWALSRPAQAGVAGGLTARERVSERRRRQRRAS